MTRLDFVLVFILLGLARESAGQVFSFVDSFETESILTESTGVSVADYDLDGDLDIFLVSGKVFHTDDPLSWSRLLRNDPEGFVDVTFDAKLYYIQEKPRTGTEGSKMGASWGDYDNDGYPDLYLTVYGYNQLWHNNGNGTFENVTEEKGVAGCYACYSANGLWWDYDQDGDLDLYVSNWIKENVLYKNQGNGSFEDISIASRLNDAGRTFTALPMDVDGDGLLDLYVINDAGANNFFRNLGNDRFEEITQQVGLSDIGDGMGVDVGDYNLDGHFDIYVTNIYYFYPNAFFVNNGDGSFSNRSRELGIDNTGTGWGIRFFDVEHDMDEDMYVVNGKNTFYAKGDRNKLFLNVDEIYSDASAASGLDNLEMGKGLETLDYDQDGDLDLVIANQDAHSQLIQNKTVEIGNKSNWIQIWLEGTTSNRDAIGSVVRIECGGKSYFRYHTGTNLLGQSLKPVHFGLADHEFINLIEVTWPDGKKELIRDIAANQVIRLKEGTLESAGDIGPLSTSSTELSIKVFPNPFNNYLEVWTDVSSTFSLYSLTGQLIHQESALPAAEPFIVPTITLEAGLYFYQLHGSNSVYSGILIKR